MASPAIRQSADQVIQRSAPGVSGAVSNAIRTLRLPLLAGPLFVHACLDTAHSTLQFVLARTLGDIAVPAFFLISGLLYFASFDGTARCWLRKLANRIRSLAVPYLLWNLIGYFLLAHAVHMVAKCDFLRSFWAVDVAYRNVDSAPVDGPLYFMKGLYFLAFGAPVLHFALRRRALSWFAPAALLFWVASPISALEGRMAVVALAFFSCGGCIAINRPEVLERIVSDRRAALAAVAAFLALSALNVGLHASGAECSALLRANIVAGIPFCFAAAAALGDGRAARLLRRSQGFAMFLFCSFDLIMVYMRKVWRPLRDASDATCLRVAAMTFAVSLALYLALSLVARPLLRLLTGDRANPPRHCGKAAPHGGGFEAARPQ